jgi:fatty-acyl-CoA synthase
MAYPNVIEAAVVGLPHPKWEERPIALIVVRREIGNEVRKEEILEFLGRTFSKWQLPEDIKLVDEIPKTSVGKFDKKKIREMYKEEFS